MKEFLEKYQDEELLILSDKVYLDKIIKLISKQNRLYNFTYLSLEDLAKLKYFDFNDATLKHLARTFNLVPEVSRIYLNNFKYLFLLDKEKLNEVELTKYHNLEKYYQEVNNELFLKDNSSYLAYLKTKKVIYLSNHALAKEYQKLLADFKIETYQLSFSNKDNYISQANNIHDLYFYVFEEIAKLVSSGVSQSDIYLVTKSNDNNLRFYLDLYGFNLNVSKSSLYAYKLIKDELTKIKEHTFNLEELERNILSEKLVNILKKYDLDKDYEFILEEVKHTKVNLNEFLEAINTISVEEAIFLEDKYLFVFPLNETILPSLAKDEDYFLDYTKQKFNLTTTLNKNLHSKNNLIDLTNSNNKIYLYSYLKDVKKEYKVSACLANLDVKKLSSDYYSQYSNSLNKILLTRYMDLYLKTGKEMTALAPLVSTYGNIYNTYDNKFIPFNYEIKDNLIELSYSSFTRLRNCTFTYYIDKILGLNISDSTIYTVTGNVFHYVLEESYEEDFDFDLCFDKAIKRYLDDKFTKSDEEYLYILKDKLKDILEAVKSLDELSDFKDILREEKFDLMIPFTVDNKDYHIHLKGFIDKLYLKEVDGKTFITIIDYKTGSSDVVNLNDIEDGLHMQLAIYMYLVIKSGRFTNPIISGVYLHKIFDSPLKLEGYTNIDNNVCCFERDFYHNGKSEIIKGLSIKKDGDFAKSAKVFKNDDVNYILEKTEEWLISVACKIVKKEISISPDVIVKHLSDVPYNELSFINYKDLKWEVEEDEVDA